MTEDISGDVQEEADQSYDQVLAEVGLEMVGGQAVPTGKIAGKKEVKQKGEDLDDLEKRLKDLKA